MYIYCLILRSWHLKVFFWKLHKKFVYVCVVSWFMYLTVCWSFAFFLALLCFKLLNELFLLFLWYLFGFVWLFSLGVLYHWKRTQSCFRWLKNKNKNDFQIVHNKRGKIEQKLPICEEILVSLCPKFLLSPFFVQNLDNHKH